MTPKNLYLDQNQWIYLAKDYWGRPHSPKHTGIAERVLAMVTAGDLRIPLNTIHLIEHLRAEDPGRRQRLAEVFELFGGGWYMASWSLTLPFEIHQAVANAFGVAQRIASIEIFGRGFLFGLSPAVRKLLEEGRTEARVGLLQHIAALPGATFELLTFPNEPGRSKQNRTITDLAKANTDAAESLRQLRRSDGPEVSRRAQYAGYTLHHHDLLLQELQSIGKNLDAFLSLGIERLGRFWSSIPSLDVDCELTLYRDRQWTRAVEGNDVRDIGHLALAIPYCDVVATERFWTRAAAETGLAKKYETAVCSDLTQAVNHLQ